MTHFKVSDEAVRVAGEAVEKATAQLEMVQCVAYDREVSEAIARIAIEAALPVMFKQVAFGIKYEGEGADRFEVRDLSLNRDIAEEAVHLAQSRIAPNWPVKVSAVPLYCVAIKESK